MPFILREVERDKHTVSAVSSNVQAGGTFSYHCAVIYKRLFIAGITFQWYQLLQNVWISSFLKLSFG